MKKEIDINCDLGEGMPFDQKIMPYLGSCNIACGGHAGDDASMEHTIGLAKKHQVKIGAHPSYPDKDNFGRISLDLDIEILKDSLKSQIEKIKSMAIQEKVNLHHIKFHGALYLDSLIDQELALELALFIKHHFPNQILYAPFGSCMANAAVRTSIPLCHEVFADRKYASATELLPRKHPRAILTDLKEIDEQVSLLLAKSSVKTIDGDFYKVKADTICIHGDHPRAVEIAKLVATKLAETTNPHS
ncbi:5-oxoprolinase subunit PxpA [Cyclobacterium sp.]|uniref:5-oxoprolinase subunit PxpA n=1 Tax=Cyclobacterium sp. TaxID=1966343 RepID=UPI0019C7C58C|nr:5-oxoprolinase subunit PxpA [Cyclobacterium sp.]MBD3628766.1 5-oxoprolinase subunit PxpA [Cyclobacterium sp.]